mgnify:CR=1 FL=1
MVVSEAAGRISHTSGLSDGVATLRYVSGRREEGLRRLGLRTVRDVLLHVPHRYLDFTTTTKIGHATLGSDVTIVGTVDEVTLAAQALVADKVDAVFTPTDNTIMTAELSIYEILAQAGIPHYTGADSFALNGAFLGYGVDYANLGVETANMIAEILVDGANPASTGVMTFDNGTATVNTETCEALGLDYDAVAAAFAPYCTQVQSITTAESFSDLG